MIKTTTKILLIIFLLPCFLQNQAEASAETQEYIIKRLNSIRSDPLAYAEELGHDPQLLLKTLPFLNEFIEKDIEPFIIDEFLNLKADNLNSPEVLEPDLTESDPAVSPENDYAYTGQTKWTISFANFMNMKTAVKIVIDNLFEKELDPEFEGQRYILSSNFDLAGASLRSGLTWGPTGMKNSYIITACFGSSLLKSEVQVFNMINQVRAYLLKNNDYRFFDITFLFPENLDVLKTIYASDETYQPLFIDNKIVFNNPNPDYLNEFIEPFINDIETDKSSIPEIFSTTDSNSLAALIFSSLISNESRRYPEKKIIFNPDFNDAELSYTHTTINDELDEYNTELSITAGNRISEDTACSKIYGIIYKDMDENGVYTPGEGAAQETVIIQDKETSEKIKTIITDNAGHFSVNLLNQKEYTLQVRTQTETDEIIPEKNIYVLDHDEFFILNINIRPPESEISNVETEME